ncbi:MAG: DUF7483 domain-containing protein [Dehalococcoidia bacterium]
MRVHDERGLGLVELILGLAISSMLLTTLGMALTATFRTATTAKNQQNATEQLRDAFFWLNQDTQSGVASQASVAAGDVTMRWTDYASGKVYSSRFQQVGATLQRTFTVNGVASTRTVASDLIAAGFTATRSGNAVTYGLTVQDGASTRSMSETALMRVADTPPTAFPTVTPAPATGTPTPTATATSTPTATATSTPTPTYTPTAVATATSTPTPTPTAAGTPTLTPTPTPSPWFETGSYTGDGTNNRTISGLTFQPDIVIVRDNAGDEAVIRTSLMPANMAKVITSGSNLQSGTILSFLPNGFTVGTSSWVNSAGTTYYWVAMKRGINVNIGTYTGDGTDNRNITGVGFQPNWVITMGDGDEDFFRPALLPGDASFNMGGSKAKTNRIQAILADGFQIGSDDNVNAPGLTFYWIAFNSTPKVVTSTYIGNGVAGRNIAGLGMGPGLVWVKAASNDIATWRLDVVPGDSSLYWDNTNPTTNRIMALFYGGFQVGSDPEVNRSGQTYYYLGLAP